MKPTGHLIPLVNLFSFLLSTALLGAGIWVATHATTTADFILFLQWPLLAVSGATVLILVAAICFRSTFIIYLYTCAASFILPTLIGLFVLGLATAANDNASGRPVFNRAYQDYYLQDYSAWMEARVSDPGYWAKTSARVRDSGVCGNLGRGVSEAAEVFYKRNLTPIQSGCCKPPTECGFAYVNETTWNTAVVGGVKTANPDCNLWSNEQGKLCYSCRSCKAGVIATRRHCLMGILSIGTLLVIMLAITYLVADRGLNRMEMHNAGETLLLNGV